MLDSLKIQLGSRLESPVSVAKKDAEFQKRKNHHEGRLREDRMRVDPRHQSPMKGKGKPLSATHIARPPTAMHGNKGTQMEKMSSLKLSPSTVALDLGLI